jgi:hypothetical protein
MSEFFDIPVVDYDKQKQALKDHMLFLKSMDVYQQTFYKKWYEVQTYKKFASKLSIIKAKIWMPTDINDEKKTAEEISNINPIIKLAEGAEETEDWLLLRIFGHTMEFSQTPGRFLKFLVVDNSSGENKYLGVVSISSDIISVMDRDKYIGWTSAAKLKGKKAINNTAIGSCIMSTQPFGYNFLGGKLVACLITTDVIRDVWKRLYKDTLVGMTTTSLYGSYSMYNSLKWWHKCGTSAGKVALKPDDNFYKIWHDIVKEKHKKRYDTMMTQKEGVSGPVTAAKQRTLAMIFNEVGIKQKDFIHGFQRGTYYSCFYDNTKEFLCGKIEEKDLKMKPLIAGGKNEIINWWRPKAIDRYINLKKENNIKADVLFYDKMIDLSYADAKKIYLADVGR